MRPVASLAIVLLTSSFSATALADGGSTSKKKGAARKSTPTPVLIAALEPLPPPPPASAPAPSVAAASAPVAAPLAAPVTKDAPPTLEPTTRPSAGPGLVLGISSGFTGLGGSLAEGAGVGAPLITFGLSVGGYVTRHVGLIAGVQGGYGALTAGCAGDCANAFAYQIPLVAQYAFEDRSRGVYVEGGFALLTTYGGSTDTKKNPDASPETIKMSAPFDLKLGAGYRVSLGPKNKVSTTGLDLRLGVDLGQFTSLEYRSVGVDVSGEIASDKRALHVAVGFGVAYHFSP